YRRADPRSPGPRGGRVHGRRADRSGPAAAAPARGGRQSDGACDFRASRASYAGSREDVMNVGIALNMLHKEGRSDASVFHEHMALGDLAEPLGFDSLWALEHHFTGYAMSPAPTQLLAYYAGRTRRIMLGTAVIV